ncbi:hypothetical protein DFR70_12435 [Nocardia tenerifensis]|uniref:Substrate-binding family protein n=1 Tax=Nocardia tenerifensis TaxID=228006 RepID=A0A318JMV1_9NOCA|nr:hypothetical protein DFR70_12435 [Nocardia tenerifensis]
MPRPAPLPHTEAELERLLAMARQHQRSGTTVSIGHSRDACSVAAAEAFASAWRARGHRVSAVVDWPEDAASWLRQAERLTAGSPDVWVFAAAVEGFVQLSRRLVHSTGWAARRSLAFASLADPLCAELAGPGVLDGLRGATKTGGSWGFSGREVIFTDD